MLTCAWTVASWVQQKREGKYEATAECPRTDLWMQVRWWSLLVRDTGFVRKETTAHSISDSDMCPCVAISWSPSRTALDNNKFTAPTIGNFGLQFYKYTITLSGV